MAQTEDEIRGQKGAGDMTALAAVSRTLKTMADGTIRLQIDFQPNDRGEVMTLFGEPGTPMAVTRLSVGASQAMMREEQLKEKTPYGEQAAQLRLSGFFDVPNVYEQIGTDKEFLDFLKGQKCCVKTTFHAGDIVAAHVRRINKGAGTGIKPKYSAVPLCNHHHQQQHSQGESSIGDKEWWDTKATLWRRGWAWASLKQQLGYDSWAFVPPEKLREWAEAHDVLVHLPSCYK